MIDTRPGMAGGTSGEGESHDALFTSENLLKVLAAVRGSALPKEEKMRIRDLILSYAQADDAEKGTMQAALAEAFATHRTLVELALERKMPDARPAEAVQAAPLGRTRRTPSFAPVAAASIREEAAPVSKPPEERPAPPPEPVAAPVETPVEEAQPAMAGDPKARIAAIKRAVNERVGNPVNLIELDQDVGREYMTALLDAIKYSSGGAPSGGAMARLEAAYEAVVQLLEKTPMPKEEPKAAEPEPVAPPRTAEPKIETEKVAPPAPPPAESRPVTPSVPRTGAQIRSLAETVRLPRTDMPPAPRPPAAPKADPAPPPVPPVPRAADVPQETEDGLKSSDVEAGLRQLLSEWKLFRRSGLLGTGPSGIEHPLYKQLAGLPMAAVIAGRFEGSTPEVKQSITDYMNGWRYEHGIVHKMEEHFEHYLRRVIRDILKKQKEGPKEQ